MGYNILCRNIKTIPGKMRFGARLCFYTCVSFCSRGGEGEGEGVRLPSTHHRFHDWVVCIHWGICIQVGWADPSWVCLGGRTDPVRYILWDTVNKRVVRILLECILASYCVSPIPSTTPVSPVAFCAIKP